VALHVAGQATSSTSSTINIQLITNALADYAKITGVDLSKNPFGAAIKQSNSPEAILELLQERDLRNIVITIGD
jgi:hypothetical protein